MNAIMSVHIAEKSNVQHLFLNVRILQSTVSLYEPKKTAKIRKKRFLRNGNFGFSLFVDNFFTGRGMAASLGNRML